MSDGDTVHVVTLEVAGLVCRMECTWPKPRVWVTELHPAFLSSRLPDLWLTIDYDDAFWTRGLPWIGPDVVADVPLHTASGDGAVIRSDWYELTVNAAGTRACASVAGGFAPGGMLRALYAALLPRRHACLIRGVVRPTDDGGATLVCDDRAATVVALVVDDGRIGAEPTPFGAETSPCRTPRQWITAVDLGDATDRAGIAGRLLAHALVVDHSPATVEQVLDVVTRLAASVPGTGRALAFRGAHGRD